MPRSDFYYLIGAALVQSAYSGNNPDGTWRVGPPAPAADGRIHYSPPASAKADLDRYNAFFPLFSDFNRATAAFADEVSGHILAMIVAYRILGPERIQLNISPTQYTEWMKNLAPLMVKSHTHEVPLIKMVLDQYDLRQNGIPLVVHTTRSSLLAHFFLRQYELRRDPVNICVEAGDIVIEGGMGFGDTALMLAFQAGEKGRVVGFEFEPGNLKVIGENFAANPAISQRVEIVKSALSDESGKEMTFIMNGPATMPVWEGMDPRLAKMTVQTVTVDDIVEKKQLQKVDFIKLDVEGSEMATLRGATETLRRFKPKLAISAYHKIDDVPRIIDFLVGLDLGYRYWLDHFRYYDQETILFARVEDS